MNDYNLCQAVSSLYRGSMAGIAPNGQKAGRGEGILRPLAYCSVARFRRTSIEQIAEIGRAFDGTSITT